MKKIILSALLLTMTIIPLMASATHWPGGNLNPLNWIPHSGGTSIPGAGSGGFSRGPVIVRATDLIATLNNIVNWLFTVLLIVAAIFIIIASFNFITAAGEPEKIKTARQFVIYALIGVVVAFLARGLVGFAINVVV